MPRPDVFEAKARGPPVIAEPVRLKELKRAMEQANRGGPVRDAA